MPSGRFARIDGLWPAYSLRIAGIRRFFLPSLPSARAILLWNAAVVPALCGLIWVTTPQAALAACGLIISSTTHVTGSVACLSWEGGDLDIDWYDTGTGEVVGADEAILYTGTGGTFRNNNLVSGTDTGFVVRGDLSDFNNNGTTEGTGAAGVGILIESTGSVSRVWNIDDALVQGTVAGIDNAGHIGEILNDPDGTIQGDDYGIRNSGTLDLITNSGTIRSDGVAIRNEIGGVITQITNTGTIAGDITNASTVSLTLSGGADAAHMGILTGSDGTTGAAHRGSITSTAANLIFKEGYLLLNSNIDVGAYAVTNTGAVLQVDNAIAITGDYVQTGGRLVATASNGTIDYGYLSVSGDATISNSTVTVSGPNLALDQRFVLVDAGGTGSYSNNTATVAVTNGLAARLEQDGEDLVVVLTRDDANTYTAKGRAAGGNGEIIGAALDAIFDGPSRASFQSVFNAIDTQPGDGQGDAIRQLAPSNLIGASHQAANALADTLRSRQLASFSYSGNAPGALALPYAPTDVIDEPFAQLLAPPSDAWSLWGQVLGGASRRGADGGGDETSAYNVGLVAGIDRQFTDRFSGGAALGWVQTSMTGSGNKSGSTSNSQTYQGSVYGTFRQSGFVLEGQLGLGGTYTEQKRPIRFLGATAESSFAGQHYAADARIGYDLRLGGVTLTPRLGLRVIHARSNGYQETGAGAANLTIEPARSTSIAQDLGASLSWGTNTALGDLATEISLAWLHDYAGNSATTTATLGGQRLAVTHSGGGADGIQVGLAATLHSANGLSMRMDYTGEWRPGYQGQNGQIRISKGF